MKKILSAILSVLIVAVAIPYISFPVEAEADGIKTEGLLYTIEDNNVTVTGYEGTDSEVIIPETIDGATVTSIGEKAFYNNQSIYSITIPKTVTSIGKNAFELCKSLYKVSIESIEAWVGTSFANEYSNPLWNSGSLYINGNSSASLVLPEGITRIEKYAFYGCNSFERLIIPEGVTYIGNYAFCGCSSLKQVFIPNSVKYIKHSAFHNLKYSNCSVFYCGTPDELDSCMSLNNFQANYSRIKFNISGITEEGIVYEITEGSEVIIHGIASDYQNFKTLIVPGTIEGLPVTGIGMEAFSYNKYIQSVTIPKTLKSIGEDAFKVCEYIEAVEIESLEAWLNIDFANAHSNPMWNTAYLYLNGEKITELVIPNGVTSIGKYAFNGIRLDNSVIFPEGLTSIGDYAFADSSLTGVILPEGLKSIGDYAFADSSLTGVILPEGVTSIGKYAFYDCYYLKYAVLPKSINSIGYHAFSYIDSYSVFYFGSPSELDNCTEDVEFSNLYVNFRINCNISGITDEGIVYEITEDSEVIIHGFIENSSNIVIPSKIDGCPVAEIDGFAFYDVGPLESVSIPHEIKRIHSGAFLNCKGIETVYYDGARHELDSIDLASSYAKISYIYKVVYNIIPVEGLILTGGADTVIMEPGEHFSSTFERYPENANDLITLSVSSGGDYVSVSGMDIYAKKAGEARICATAESGVTYEFTVKVIGCTSITIDSLPIKLRYSTRSSLDTTGLTVTAHCNDGTSTEVTDYTISGFNSLKKGVQTITVAYKDQTATFEVIVSDAMAGDVDLDGKITGIDSNYLKRVLAGKMTVDSNTDEFFACDINGDGQINAVDSALLKRMIAG